MSSANTPPLKINRNQLAKFLDSHDQIKQFENLFSVVEEIAPTQIQEIYITSVNAAVTAIEALAQIENLKNNINIVLESAMSSIGALTQELALLKNEIGVIPHAFDGVVLSAGNNININHINGGNNISTTPTITATIVDDTSNLISSSATLSDSSGSSIGMLTNAPSAGNPSKWITIDDNGTARYIPTWS